MSKPYSYSKLSTYKQCPRKYYWSYIEPAPKDKTDITALLKGRAVHSILEHFPEKSTHSLAEKFQSIADSFIASDLGKKYMYLDAKNEYKFALDNNLNPCSYSDKNAIFRGIIDYICFLDRINLIDWKTGKEKELRWQEFDQLMFYAIYFFKKYTKVQEIRISYVYVEHNSENDVILERKYLNNYIKDLLTLIISVKNDTVFERKESKLCEYCDVRTHCSQHYSV